MNLGGWKLFHGSYTDLLLSVTRSYDFFTSFIDNMSAWERYEQKRNDLLDKLAGADKELDDIKKVIID